jgi:hypothetical protein
MKITGNLGIGRGTYEVDVDTEGCGLDDLAINIAMAVTLEFGWGDSQATIKHLADLFESMREES